MDWAGFVRGVQGFRGGWLGFGSFDNGKSGGVGKVLEQTIPVIIATLPWRAPRNLEGSMKG